MYIDILPNPHKDKAIILSEYVKEKLERLGHKALINEKDFREMKPDLLLALGGDGTFLRTAHIAHFYDIPLAAINTGTYGYLTNCDIEGIDDWLYTIDEMRIQECLTLEYAYDDKCAFNEFVISDSLNYATFKIFDGQEMILEYKASALIIATPLGSTGINRSANGPILDLSLDEIVFTPICPIHGNGRPYVYKIKERLEIITNHDCVIKRDGRLPHRDFNFVIYPSKRKLKKVL